MTPEMNVYMGNTHSYTVVSCFALQSVNEWVSVRLCVCVPGHDDPGRDAAEDLGHIQTIENNAARYHVTSQLNASQQLRPCPKLS